MWHRSRLHIWVAAAIMAGVAAPAHSAETGAGLLPPREVVLYVHSTLKDTRFLEPLVCALERVLVAPVSVRKLELPLGPELLATPTQFDVGKVAKQLFRATSGDGDSRTFKYLLLAPDLKGAPFHYVFATSFGNQTTPFHLGVVSTARLDPGETLSPRSLAATVTADRVYKLVLKSVARLAGYSEPEGCILAFPRSLDELDRKPAQFCAADRAVLVAAGILKAKPDGGCTPIVDARPGPLFDVAWVESSDERRGMEQRNQ